MVRYVSIGILVMLFFLAMISRKNYSKYKDGEKASGNPFWWVAGWIADHIGDEIKRKVSLSLKRVKVMNSKPLEVETKLWIRKQISFAVMFLAVLAAAVTVLSFVPEQQEDPYKVTRPGLREGSKYVELKLVDEEENTSEDYTLEVHSREYTEEEFHFAAEAAKTYLDGCFLGENPDTAHITEDLVFPVKDETKTLKITWETSSPILINSEGHVSQDEKLLGDSGKDVDVTASISDGNYTEVYEKTVTVLPMLELSGSERTKRAMLEIEEEMRSQEELDIPDRIGEVKIERSIEDADTRNGRILAFGIILIILWIYYSFYRLTKQGTERDGQLEDAYYGFVNRLTIYIGAGLPIRKALYAAITKEDCKYLRDEVGFTLNMIDTGMSERNAISELGKRLASEKYKRLMSIISQNISMGNSNLLRLLDGEVSNSRYLKREHIRKKGEQASEKLLIPTGLLLVLVIIIVIYPALVGL